MRSVKFIIPLVIFLFHVFFIEPSHFQVVVLGLLCAKCQEWLFVLKAEETFPTGADEGASCLQGHRRGENRKWAKFCSHTWR